MACIGKILFLMSGASVYPLAACGAGYEVKDSVLVIPGDTKVIERDAFRWREDFHSVKFESPVRVRDIQAHAFAYCPNLRRIDVPEGVGHIGSNAFCFCTRLEEAVLPSSVTELESYAFAECDSLRRAVLPANPKMLGELIFEGCRNLEEIVELSPVPPAFDCGSTLFDPLEACMYRRCRLTVPPASESAYRAAPGWSHFFDCSYPNSSE